MKKVYTLIFIALLSLSLFAQQVPREVVLMEFGTATWCGPCSGANNAAIQIENEGHPVIFVKYQLSDGQWTVPSSTARAQYYGISGIPHARIDGILNHIGGGNPYGIYMNHVNTRLATPTSFTMELSGNFNADDNSGNLTVKVNQVGPNTDNLKVYVSLTETVDHNWQSFTQLKHMNRNMLPDASGTPITISEGGSAQVDLPITVQSNWIPENMKVVAWVQNDVNKEIHVAMAVNLLNLAPSNILEADFFAEETEVCTNEPIQFTNASQGPAFFYKWEFPGGKPNESSTVNPVVTYDQPGIFDVTLTIWNGNDTATITKESYMVINGPELAFDELPEMCVFWEPYELTEGQPAGGTYSGEGVIDGYFHPQETGVGTFEITYTFTDDDGCTAEVLQIVGVDECTSVDEIAAQKTLTIFPNPTSGQFVVEVNSMANETVDVKVYNKLGNLVLQQNHLRTNAGQQLNLDLSGQAEGIYMLHIQVGNETHVQRIVLTNK